MLQPTVIIVVVIIVMNLIYQVVNVSKKTTLAKYYS